jgi:hypothetical protein
MALDRTTIIRGPAVIKKGSTVIYTEGDVTVTAEVTTTEGISSVVGKYDEYMDTVVHNISFKPASQATALYFAALFPYTNPTLGASIYGAAPDDLIVWSVDGKQYTYKCAALTSMPGLSLAPSTPLFDGEAVFTAIGDCAEDWSGTDHFAAVASVAFSDTSFNAANDFRLHYAAAWGSDPWDDFETEAGFKISFDLQLEDVLSDSYGIIDKSITGLSASATFTPQGISAEAVLSALGIQGAGAKRGRSMLSLGSDLVLSNSVVGEPEITLYNAVLKGNSTQVGASVNRVGELTLSSMRSMTAGALNAVFSIGLKSA